MARHRVLERTHAGGPGGPDGFGQGTGISVGGKDQIEKDIKYLIDGIHSRDVL